MQFLLFLLFLPNFIQKALSVDEKFAKTIGKLSGDAAKLAEVVDTEYAGTMAEQMHQTLRRDEFNNVVDFFYFPAKVEISDKDWLKKQLALYDEWLKRRSELVKSREIVRLCQTVLGELLHGMAYPHWMHAYRKQIKHGLKQLRRANSPRGTVAVAHLPELDSLAGETLKVFDEVVKGNGGMQKVPSKKKAGGPPTTAGRSRLSGKGTANQSGTGNGGGSPSPAGTSGPAPPRRPNRLFGP